MKIVIVGSTTFDSLEYNLNEAFNVCGCQCSIVDVFSPFLQNNKYLRILDAFGRRYLSGYDQKLYQKVFDKVVSYKPDLVICVYRFIHPNFVHKVKKMDIPVIHVNPDALTTFERQQLFVETYDLYFTKDPYIAHFMVDKMKLKVKLYSEAFNKRIHKRPELDKKNCEEKINIDVLAFGNLYPYRSRMLSYLKENGINLSLYGAKSSYFSHFTNLNDCFQNKYIVGTEKATLLYGAKIVFNNLHYAEIESVNNKFFEINGSGAFQLCDYRPILNELLPIDPELISFRTIDDAVDKIYYYLEHPYERYNLSNQIYEYFVEHYSYDTLVEYILSSVKEL